jgi:uncharacterized membrane protein
MMFDRHVLFAIAALAVATYALRAGGFLAAGAVPEHGVVMRFLRKAPGNLFIAFVAAACLQSGWSGLVGCVCGLVAMAVTRKEWAGLAAGFAATAIAAAWGV